MWEGTVLKSLQAWDTEIAPQSVILCGKHGNMVFIPALQLMLTVYNMSQMNMLCSLFSLILDINEFATGDIISLCGENASTQMKTILAPLVVF